MDPRFAGRIGLPARTTEAVAGRTLDAFAVSPRCSPSLGGASAHFASSHQQPLVCHDCLLGTASNQLQGRAPQMCCSPAGRHHSASYRSSIPNDSGTCTHAGIRCLSLLRPRCTRKPQFPCNAHDRVAERSQTFRTVPDGADSAQPSAVQLRFARAGVAQHRGAPAQLSTTSVHVVVEVDNTVLT